MRIIAILVGLSLRGARVGMFSAYVPLMKVAVKITYLSG